MKHFIFFVLFGVLIQVHSYAGTRSGYWLGSFGTARINDDVSLFMETQLRKDTNNGTMSQVLYRTGFLQNLNSRHQLGYLYAFIHSNSIKEERYTLQHMQAYKINDMNISHRMRFEFRTLENSNDDAARFRYLIRFEDLMNIHDKLLVWNELFINLTKERWTGNRDTERNRFFLGIKDQYGDFRVEYGYLNQFTPRDEVDTYEHLLVLYFYI